jgi:hypothetical protein
LKIIRRDLHSGITVNGAGKSVRLQEISHASDAAWLLGDISAFDHVYPSST